MTAATALKLILGFGAASLAVWVVGAILIGVTPRGWVNGSAGALVTGMGVGGVISLVVSLATRLRRR